MWIDTHAHLNDERFADQIPAVLARAHAAGVEAILVIGIDPESSQRAVELAGRHEPLYAVVGIQPNSLDSVDDADFICIEALSRAPKVVAIGETGMDRHWNTIPIERQRDSFERHLELARRRDLPVVIHCREAEFDVVSVLVEFQAKTGSPIAGVMHSYTGDATSAQKCIELGLHVSFAGMVTYKGNEALRSVAATIPADRLLLETDAPYLPPQPVRGKMNEPACLPFTAECLARVRETPLESIARSTTENAARLFRLAARR